MSSSRTTGASSRFVVGGVTEPMNRPWELAIADGSFAGAGLDVRWVDQPGGTGAIATALTQRTLDAATVLTEGAIAAIVNGAPLRIHSLWVQSPLVWGIHVSGLSTATTIRDFVPVRFAVSRLGSGSHLMAYLLAARDGVPLTTDQLVVVGDIDGARAALRDGRADVFLWEKYVTSPLVHRGEFRRLDTMPTPWPSFAIAAHVDTIDTRRASLDDLVAAARTAAHRFETDPSAGADIAHRYGLTASDAAEWLTTYDFARSNSISAQLVDDVQQRLRRVGAIDSTRPADQILA
jgi:ABC-type nitrate/sulfonate/bicarbonate transport system substrate-binding protein